MLKSSSPIFATTDVAASARFYEEVLGFQSSWTYGTPATFAGASFGNVQIMFSYQPDLAAKVEGHEHWLAVEDVDALYSAHVERGAQIVSPIENKPWGRREYVVRDPNGYL